MLKLTVYEPAEKQRRVVWSRYGDATIGVAIVAFGRCWSLRWRSAPVPDKNRVSANSNVYGWMCGAWQSGASVPARCTQQSGHDGEHKAKVDSGDDDFGSYPTVFARWPQSTR